METASLVTSPFSTILSKMDGVDEEQFAITFTNIILQLSIVVSLKTEHISIFPNEIWWFEGIQ